MGLSGPVRQGRLVQQRHRRQHPTERNGRRGSLACLSVCVSIARQDYLEGDRTAMCMRVETLRERGRHSSSFLLPPLPVPCRPTAALPRRLGRCGLPPNWDVCRYSV